MYLSHKGKKIYINISVLSSQVLLHMSSKQKVFITKATIPDTFLSTNLCFPLLCSYKWLPNKKHSLNKLRFRTHSHHKLCAFFSCAFTNIFQTKSIHYTSYNSGHILIIKFVLSSHVLLQMSSKQKVFITETTILCAGVPQWCIIRLTCSHPELTKDHVLTSAYVIIFEPSREML